MIYFIKFFTDIIGKVGWWSLLVIPLVLVAIVWGVELTGGFNINTGNLFLDNLFDLLFKQVDGE
jgi:hypothetical protein